MPPLPGRSVALWGLAKKKPLALARQAHGMQDAQGLQQPYWISAVAALRNSDLLATGVGQLLWSKGLGVQGVCPAPAPAPGWGAWQSPLSTLGSHSASVKLWKCSEGFRKLEPLWAIPLVWVRRLGMLELGWGCLSAGSPLPGQQEEAVRASRPALSPPGGFCQQPRVLGSR